MQSKIACQKNSEIVKKSAPFNNFLLLIASQSCFKLESFLIQSLFKLKSCTVQIVGSNSAHWHVKNVVHNENGKEISRFPSKKKSSVPVSFVLQEIGISYRENSFLGSGNVPP